MQIFKSKWFHKWAIKERVGDIALKQAIAEMEAGLIEADLGGRVYKKRVAVGGRGKRSGLRAIVAYRAQSRAIFLYGFAKNQRANIDETELRVFRLLAREILNHDDEMCEKLVRAGELVEVSGERHS